MSKPRRKACRHENVTDKYGETTHDLIGDIVYEVEYRECLDCGAWLPLGPSNDKGCEVEIRAAELAVAWKPVGGVRKIITDAERQGWSGWPYRQPMREGEHVGFLAAQIVNHERDIGDVNWAGHHMADHPIGARCISTHLTAAEHEEP